MQNRRLVFNDYPEYLHYVATKPLNPHSHNYSENESVSWAGASWEGALKLAHTGWIEGYNAYVKKLSAIVASVIGSIARPEIQYDTEGASIDVSRYLDGEPEHWMQWHESNTAEENSRGGSIVTIIFNMSVSGGLGNTTLLNRGAGCLALAELLEVAGKRVRIVVVDGTLFQNGYYKLSTWIPCKEPEQMFDHARLAFCIIHPAMQRRLWYRLAEQQMEFTNSSMMPCEIESAMIPSNSLYMGCAIYGEKQWENEKTTQQWVVDTLKSFGVQFNDDMEG